MPGDAIRFSFTADMRSNVDGEANSDDDQITSVEKNDRKTIVISCDQINLVVFSLQNFSYKYNFFVIPNLVQQKRRKFFGVQILRSLFVILGIR